LNITLVRGLLLEKGYMMLQVGNVIGVPIHVPLLHVSLTVQPFPSLHGSVLFVCVQTPVAGTQLSFVHTLLSLQFFGVPDLQLPFWQTSPMVHPFPSLQGAVLFVCTQPICGSQESSVHGLWSSQLSGGPPLQVPF
jgi:hypothetical protein